MTDQSQPGPAGARQPGVGLDIPDSPPESPGALRALERLIELLGPATDLPHPLVPVLGLLGEAAGAQTVAILIPAPPGGTKQDLCQIARRKAAGWEPVPGAGPGALLPRVVSSGLSWESPAVELDPALSTQGKEPWEQGPAIVVPVAGETGTVGALAALRPAQQPFSSSDFNALVAGATLVAATVARATLHEREGRHLVELMGSLSSALDARDPYTRGHSERVGFFALAILNELERQRGEPFPAGFRHGLLLASLLHDVGKIGIPDQILLKKEKLSPDEYALIKEHTLKGAQILHTVSGLDEVRQGILLHHERLDGSGYPEGLSGDQIPLTAQIVGLADAFDAITSTRPYSSGSSDQEAARVLATLAGTKFRPELVKALLAAHRDGILADRPSQVEESPAGAGVRAEPPAPCPATQFAGLGRAQRLPAMPEIVHTVLQKLQDPRASAKDVVQAVSVDQGLVSEILKQVNSAFYGLGRRVASVQQAVTILGTVALQHLVIDAGVARIFRAGGGKHRAALEALWDHSVRCAIAARALAAQSRAARPDESFTAGILHDIGHLAMIQGLEDRWESFAASSGTPRPPDSAAERSAFGFDHCQVGHWLAGRWQLPEPLADAIGRHHETEGPEPGTPAATVLARLVRAGDWLAWQSVLSEPGKAAGEAAGAGEDLPPQAAPPEEAAWLEEFGVQWGAIEPILTEIRMGAEEASGLLG